ncbi:MAG: hypothetical protein ACRCZO_06210, partial [Cetobacterium sp.]
MDSLKTFDTNQFLTKNDLCKEGNKVFKEIYLDKEICIVNGQEKIPIKFSPGSKVKVKGVEDEIFLRFAHMSSINKDESGVNITGNSSKYDLLPCVNDFCTCAEDCCENFSEDFLEKGKHRMVCNYRMSKLYWIKEIIDKINANEDIKIIQSPLKSGRGMYLRYVKIYFESKRFKSKFIIILEKKKRGSLFELYFTTAYPVVLKSLIKKLDAEY